METRRKMFEGSRLLGKFFSRKRDEEEVSAEPEQEVLGERSFGAGDRFRQGGEPVYIKLNSGEKRLQRDSFALSGSVVYDSEHKKPGESVQDIVEKRLRRMDPGEVLVALGGTDGNLKAMVIRDQADLDRFFAESYPKLVITTTPKNLQFRLMISSKDLV